MNVSFRDAAAQGPDRFLRGRRHATVRVDLALDGSWGRSQCRDRAKGSNGLSLRCGDRGVRALELDACSDGRELPIHGGGALVARTDPGRHLIFQGLLCPDAPDQTLATEHTQLALGHVQPTAPLGRVVDLQLAQEAPSLSRGKGFVQRAADVSIQVVQHHHFGIRERDIHDVAYQVRPILARALLRDTNSPLAQQGSKHHEDVGNPLALVFVVAALHLSKAQRQ